MPDMETLDYLEEGFDPWTLTVPQLRSALVTHNIPYPSTAKKSQLVELFDEKVVPIAQKYLSDQHKAKRTSRGIVDANSQSTSTSTSTELTDRDLPPPRSVGRARSPRKVTRSRAEVDEAEPAPLMPPDSIRRRATRSASTQPQHEVQAPAASDTDTGMDAEVDVDVDVARPRRARPANSARKATPGPKLSAAPKLEPAVEEKSFKRMPDSENVFSNDNPFQSGSSPPVASKTPSKRRKTMGLDAVANDDTPSAASASRRRTDGPSSGPVETRRTSRTIQVPLSSFNVRKTPSAPVEEESVEAGFESGREGGREGRREVKREHSVEAEANKLEPGEEFTPDEQLALAQAEQENPKLALCRQSPRPKSRSNLMTPLWVLATTLMIAYAAWYRQEKMAVGYCGMGRGARYMIANNDQLPGWLRELGHTVEPLAVHVPEWAKSLAAPQCEPCPSHAYCYDDFSVRCEQDFVLKPHPFALAGLVPLPPTCEPDSEKLRRVRVVAEKAVEELRDRRAKYECGELVDKEGKPVERVSMEEQELKAIISQQRSKRMSADEFDELWSAAIGEVMAQKEIEVDAGAGSGGEGEGEGDGEDEAENEAENEKTRRTRTTTKTTKTRSTGATGDAFHAQTRLSSTSLARLPYACAIRRSAKLGLDRYRGRVVAVMVSMLSLLYGRRRYRAYRSVKAQVPGLVDQVLERLVRQKEQAFAHGDDDAFLFLPNLRDDVLRSMHRLADRDRVWQRVRKVVEQNSNVRTAQREARNGDVGRAWEWIGPSSPPAVPGSGSGSGSGRRSARPELATDRHDHGNMHADSEGAGHLAARGARDDPVARQHSRWHESRPIY